MQELIRRLVSDRSLLTQILISSFFVNLLALATPIFVIQVLQRYVAYGVTATLITLVAGVTIIIIIEFFFKNIRHKISAQFEVINANISDQLYKKIYLIPSAFFILKDIRLEKLKTNIQQISSTLNGNMLLIFIDAPFSFIFLLAVFLLHYQLGLILLLFLILPFLIARIFNKKIIEERNKTTSESIRQSIMYGDAVSKNITLKFFSLVGLAINAWINGLKSLTNSRGKFENSKNTFSSLLTSLAALLTVTIIAWGAVLSVNGELSVGALIGANILAARAIAPIIKFVQSSISLKEAQVSMNELNNILSLPNEKLKGNEIANFKGNIVLSNISLIYPQTKNPIFENINTQISEGKILCISGNNGSGKTSIIKTITGILPYSRGNILFDEIEISQLAANWLRKNISYMPQLPDFIDAPLINNISDGKKIEKHIIEQALSDADLNDFVNLHPQGIFMNMVNSRNVFPVGIIKRIAFARSLISDRKIFILDEPTEGLDEKGTQFIKSKIIQLKKSLKTIIIASSDKDIIQNADKLIDLNNQKNGNYIK